MNKRAIVIFLSIIQLIGYAQSPEQNHEKYWYYRYRLLNNFMLVGNCQGCSMPASTRGEFTYDQLYWGDATIDLGWYIGVLATEYKLLTDNNQDVSQAIKELYYALEAFNRLDYYGEQYLGGTVSLNGFFVRDDIPADFIGDINNPNSNYIHFNSNLVLSQCHTFSSYCEVTNVTSTFSIPGGPTPESLDQVCHLLMGLALVNKFVNENVTYNGLPFSDGTGDNRILHGARNIADRMIDWMRIHSWFIRNPVTGNNLTNAEGGEAILLSYAFAEAACKITDKNDFTHLLTGQTCFDYHDPITLANLPIWQSLNNPLIFTAIAVSNSYNDHLIGLLAAIGNSWYDPYPPFSPINNTTNISLSLYYTTYHQREYLSLLRQVLHGGGNLVPDNTYTDLLNSAPCEGPHNRDGQYSSYEWSTQNRFKNPEDRGSSSPFPKGEYNGLDYMLLFNLYSIVKEDYLTAYFNRTDRHVSVDFPLPFIGSDIGSHANPLVVEAFNAITADNTIQNDGDVTYRAGYEIGLLPGFSVDAGADFGAFIQPFQCVNGDYIRTANDTSTTPKAIYNEPTSYTYYANAGYNSPNSFSSPSPTLIFSKSSETHPQPEININPNPTSGLFTLSVNGNLINNVFIYNTIGQLIYQQIINSTQQIDLSSHPKGIYFVKVQSGNITYNGKVILQ